MFGVQLGRRFCANSSSLQIGVFIICVSLAIRNPGASTASWTECIEHQIEVTVESRVPRSCFSAIPNVLRDLRDLRQPLFLAPDHRQLRKLGVLLDMEEGVETLLELAADTETLRDSLADVDLSSAETEDAEEVEVEEEEERDGESSQERARRLSASSVLMSPSRTATAAAAAPTAAAVAAADGVAGAVNVKAIPTLRNTSWDKEDVGNEDTTEVRPMKLAVGACRTGACIGTLPPLFLRASTYTQIRPVPHFFFSFF